MNPHPLFCPNPDCSSRGVKNAGNIRLHDGTRNRWRCRTCGKTFSASQGTPFFGLKTEEKIVILVLTLLAYGCPLQAIVVAFGFDERTVANWQKRAGEHCQKIQRAIVEQPGQHSYVQADEMRVRLQRNKVVWMTMALCATTKLWFGGVVSEHRDKHLARAIASIVRSCCCIGKLLIVTDGWTAYRDAFLKAFRTPEYTGKRGAPRQIVWPDFVLVQTVKWQEAGRVIGIRVCHIMGACQQIASLVLKGQVVNTAFIERVNATFRQRLAGLCRRTRCLLRNASSVTERMYLIGTIYNFCTPHVSLSREGEKRTPAMAAGLSDHVWSVGELLFFRIALPPFVAPKKRGRRPISEARLAEVVQ
jgi:transposase-like protein